MHSHRTQVVRCCLGADMYSTQSPYADLYEALLACESPTAVAAVLNGWLGDHAGERAFLETWAVPVTTVPPCDDEALCRLYALSRVNDLLLCGLELMRDDYLTFMTGLGMRVVTRDAFHPYFHEIVAIEASIDPSAPPRIQRELWPGLVLGNLLFSRAGCAIEAGREHLDPDLAASTTLYWTHRRGDRPVKDLGVGWGQRSQWRTRFRRDYQLGTRLHYNVDGDIDVRAAELSKNPNPAREELTADERVELLTYRCFVRSRKPHDDLWPCRHVNISERRRAVRPARASSHRPSRGCPPDRGGSARGTRRS